MNTLVFQTLTICYLKFRSQINLVEIDSVTVQAGYPYSRTRWVNTSVTLLKVGSYSRSTLQPGFQSISVLLVLHKRLVILQRSLWAELMTIGPVSLLWGGDSRPGAALALVPGELITPFPSLSSTQDSVMDLSSQVSEVTCCRIGRIMTFSLYWEIVQICGDGTYKWQISTLLLMYNRNLDYKLKI